MLTTKYEKSLKDGEEGGERGKQRGEREGRERGREGKREGERGRVEKLQKDIFDQNKR